LAVGLFRIRRTVRLLPGAIFRVNAMHAAGSWRERHGAAGRELLRTLPPSQDAAAAPSGIPGPVPRAAQRRRPTTAVPLLVGAVLVLWLLLALSGHQ